MFNRNSVLKKNITEFWVMEGSQDEVGFERMENRYVEYTFIRQAVGTGH